MAVVVLVIKLVGILSDNYLFAKRFIALAILIISSLMATVFIGSDNFSIGTLSKKYIQRFQLPLIPVY